MQRRPRHHESRHLDFLRQLPCCICKDNTSTEAAHIRFADSRIGKPITGIATKPHDYFALPLCGKHHREQHKFGDERKFWQIYGLDPILLALAIYAVTGDAGEAERIILATR